MKALSKFLDRLLQRKLHYHCPHCGAMITMRGPWPEHIVKEMAKAFTEHHFGNCHEKQS
jgi:phage terminase large subunit GpA-like protein